MKYSEEEYENMLSRLFARFPSFQNAGASAYKPGLANMQMFDQLLGNSCMNLRAHGVDQLPPATWAWI